jgi:putative DNA primase/helicase
MSAETIARALGLRRAGREFTGKCPSCGYPTGFAVTEKQGRTLFHCHAGGCSQADVIEALQKAGLMPREAGERRRPSRERRPAGEKRSSAEKFGDDLDTDQAILAIWRRSRPIAGTVAEIYLRFRGYTGPLLALALVLRFAMCQHPSDKQFHPALVAAVVIEGRTDQCVAIHRTFLRPDGRGKADLDPDKMTLGPCKGGAVPLAPAGPVLGVAEGIETALSFMQATGIPTWAALSAGGIRNLILPAEVSEVVIAADPDVVGIRAAHDAARRWLAEGRLVRIARPPVGSDFNDLLRTAS